MKKRDLLVEGKYNRKAIMQRAWAYKNDKFCTRFRNDFKGALREAWLDARMKMDEYKMEQRNAGKPMFPSKGLRGADLYWSRDMINGYATR